MPFGGLLPYHSVGGASSCFEPFARVRPEELPCPQLPIRDPGEPEPHSISHSSLRRTCAVRSTVDLLQKLLAANTQATTVSSARAGGVDAGVLNLSRCYPLAGHRADQLASF
jgi:hypothetical protein